MTPYFDRFRQVRRSVQIRASNSAEGVVEPSHLRKLPHEYAARYTTG